MNRLVSLRCALQSVFVRNNPLLASAAILHNQQPSRSCSSSPDPNSDAPTFDMENPYKREKQQCILCKYGIELNYKNPRLLSQFTSSFTGKVYDKHITGLCDRQQKVLREQVRLAQRCGYMPIQHKHVKYMKDPQLFDPFRPTRPHPY